VKAPAAQLVGFWQGVALADEDESVDAPGLEFHLDGHLVYLSPVRDLDYVDTFLFDADEQCITTWVASVRHRTRTPYSLGPDGELTIEFASGSMVFVRADGPRTRGRHEIYQPIDPDGLYGSALSPNSEPVTGRQLVQMREERDEQVCRARGITREQLELNRCLHRLWDEHSFGPFRSVPVWDFRELLERGANPNGSGNLGETMLMLAAMRGATELVGVLLDHAAEINARDDFGWTAVKFAAVRGHVDTVRLLLERDADPRIPGSYWTETAEISETPLEAARRQERTEVVHFLEEFLRCRTND